jgi:hypothetical protein
MTDNTTLSLVAFVGLDELGSGAVGIKQALVPAGYIPLVAVASDRHKLERPSVIAALQAQADRYNVVIRLVRFVETETLLELHPKALHG